MIAAITSCTNTSNPSVMLAAGLLARKAIEAGLDDQAVGEDLAGPRLARGHRLPRPRRAHAVSRQARVRVGGLWLHDVHRQLRSADRGGGDGGGRARPQRGGGALRQPELRRPGASAGSCLLPGVAAAVRRVRARGADRRRPHDRTARGGQRRSGVPGRHLAERRRGARCDGDGDHRVAVRDAVRTHLGAATSTGRGCRRRRDPSTTGTPPPPTCRNRRSSTTSARSRPSPTSRAHACW